MNTLDAKHIYYLYDHTSYGVDKSNNSGLLAWIRVVPMAQLASPQVCTRAQITARASVNQPLARRFNLLWKLPV
jgi:hypothetical protein